MSNESEIKRLRESLGLSQQHMADTLGMSRPSYDKVEAGTKELTVTEARKLSDELGASFDTIFMNSEPSTSYDKERYKEMIRRFIRNAGADSDGRIPKTKISQATLPAGFLVVLRQSGVCEWAAVPQDCTRSGTGRVLSHYRRDV